MFTRAFINDAIAGLAAAAPAPLVPRDVTSYTLNVALAGASYDNAGVVANGRNFWFYKTTQSSCPLETGCPGKASSSSCSLPRIHTYNTTDGYVTAVSHGVNSTTLSMDTMVPGGQQVFVGPDNNLSFTGAHSNSAPVGSIFSGFSFADTGLGYNIISLEGRSFSACPVNTTYQIVTVPSGQEPVEGCAIVDLLATAYPLPTPAWQYD
jgi:hypothetical protein